ncbi:MAG: hypothetical protein CL878_02855 [Dehalococcoidia bacterium]|nr:hypothetical protein [Dehalococcoidia bacterium]
MGNADQDNGVLIEVEAVELEEHVGAVRLPNGCRKVTEVLPRGLVLRRGIAKPRMERGRNSAPPRVSCPPRG